jgi:Xaa-Pro aminopeptidase
MTLHIHPNEFAQRRQRLIEAIGFGNISIITAAPEYIRNGDTHYPYRQDSDFYYLTGFSEPEAAVVFIPGHPSGEYILFCRPRDPAMETWNGHRAGPEGVRTYYGAQQAFPIQELTVRLAELRGERQQIDPKPFIAEMRVCKSEGEIRLMRKAAEISARGHLRAMQACRPGLKEYHLEAELLHEFMQEGCRAVAYPSIVAGGINACTLHHTDNNSELRDGDLVLIDAGCEYENYASDITRTFPSNGRFSEPQRIIYSLVLETQLAIIEKIRPGLAWPDMQQTVIRMITQGLIDIGLLYGEINILLEQKAYTPFYMHGAGHWLGLDVHDVGAHKIDDEWRKLVPGMVLTVEPGIYISPHTENIDPKWWGIGIRIEDDVLVTQNGCEVLSAGAPKTIPEIETLMAASR